MKDVAGEIGMEYAQIRKSCEMLVAVEAGRLGEVVPGLAMCAKFRETPSQPCIEEYAIAK